jgi:uncharacterized protein YjdB
MNRAPEVSFKSDNSLVAKADKNGNVQGVGKGMTLITITYNNGKENTSLTCTVTVN